MSMLSTEWVNVTRPSSATSFTCQVLIERLCVSAVCEVPWIVVCTFARCTTSLRSTSLGENLYFRSYFLALSLPPPASSLSESASDGAGSAGAGSAGSGSLGPGFSGWLSDVADDGVGSGGGTSSATTTV